MRAADAARAGFAIGYAAANPAGELTERAQTACTAAMLTGTLHPRPDLAEVTLHIGHLEGVWARIFDRRLALLRDGMAQVSKAWVAAAPDMRPVIAKILHDKGVGETQAPPDPMIAAALQAALEGVPQDVTVIEALAAMLPKAQAEGVTDALALAADKAGHIGFDFDLAFEHALDALDQTYRLGSEWDAVARDWLAQALKGDVNTLTRKLSAMIRDGNTPKEILDAVSGQFEDANAVGYVVDVALSTGMNQGTINLYRQEGVQLMDFMTAGDGRVCPTCAFAEDNNPYSIDQVPQPPLHVSCRCCLASDDTIPLSAYAAYVGD